MGNEGKNGKVPLISKIAYGFGDVGCNFSWMFVSNFLMIFYTDVFGISMAAVSALMLFSRFWDAINDPIVGGLTDKTKTRWGRYRPWLLVAAPITAVLLMLTFWAHPDWPDTAKVIYMIIHQSMHWLRNRHLHTRLFRNNISFLPAPESYVRILLLSDSDQPPVFH